jgi:hypothetical protein
MSRLKQGMAAFEKAPFHLVLRHLNRIKLIKFLRLSAILPSLVTRIPRARQALPGGSMTGPSCADLASGQ